MSATKEHNHDKIEKGQREAAEKPILFSAPMVQAILDGRKMQTRRIIKSINDLTTEHFDFKLGGVYPEDGIVIFHGLLDTSVNCPYGKVGDILWVRENWSEPVVHDGFEQDYYYQADNIKPTDFASRFINNKWKPSIFMPKAACRIKLLIKNIRVERLQDISEPDAIAEGIGRWTEERVRSKPVHYQLYYVESGDESLYTSDPVDSYESLWKMINGPNSWEKNPWLWVIEFERI